MAQLQQVQLAKNTSAQATNDSVSALTVETRELHAALLQTQQQLAMFTRALDGAPPATPPTFRTCKHHHMHTYHLFRLPTHLSLMYHQRTLRFQRTFISQHHKLHTDVVVNNVSLAVKEDVAGHATEYKATLQRPQSHHPMEEQYQQPI